MKWEKVKVSENRILVKERGSEQKHGVNSKSELRVGESTNEKVDAKAIQEGLKSLGCSTPSLAKPEMGMEVGEPKTRS